MPIEIVNQPGDIKEIYAVDSNNQRTLFYRIDKKNKRIQYFTHKRFYLDEIVIEGFSRLPPEFSEGGYIKAGTSYYLSKMLAKKNVTKFAVSKDKKTSFRKSGKEFRAVFNYEFFKRLKDMLADSQTEGRLERSQMVDELFRNKFPRRYPLKTEYASTRRAKKVIKNLDSGIIKHLTSDDVEIILDFLESLLKSKYKSSVRKRQLLNAAKVRIDDIAIQNIISEFEKMIVQNPLESKWGDFLKRNLFLVDSKYVDVIPQLNVMLATARNVDFALVDYEGCLDVFEIKRPSTPLLAKSKDRGNYYWSTDATKAIAQAEKYLYNTDKKSGALSGDIARELNLKVKIQRPRAILLIGDSRPFDDNMKEDFRILRTSLKNVEVIPFNELLERIKNLVNKVYIDT